MAPPALPRLQRRAWLAIGLGGLLASGGLAAWQWRARPVAAALPEDDYCLVAPPSPYDPASGLPPQAARAVPADARCPVCGMFPARAPEWAAQLIFANGEAHFFDSPLSLFMYLQDMPRYSPQRNASEVVARYVSDSNAAPGQGWLAAEQAFYVHGSNARGPMRAGNLPAFASRSAAQAFAARRGGEVRSFAQVDAALIAELAQRNPGNGHAGHNPP